MSPRPRIKAARYWICCFRKLDTRCRWTRSAWTSPCTTSFMLMSWSRELKHSFNSSFPGDHHVGDGGDECAKWKIPETVTSVISGNVFSKFGHRQLFSYGYLFMAARCVHVYWVDIASYVINDKKVNFSRRFDSRLKFRGLKEMEHKNWVTKDENIWKPQIRWI